MGPFFHRNLSGGESGSLPCSFSCSCLLGVQDISSRSQPLTEESVRVAVFLYLLIQALEKFSIMQIR